MTELEKRLLEAVQRIEQLHNANHEYSKQFAMTLSALTKRLDVSATQITVLGAQVTALARQIESWRATLTRR